MNNLRTKDIFRIVLYPIVLLRRLYWMFLMRCNHVKWTEILYLQSFGRKISWDSPMEMNEKQRWIQFNTDTSEWTLLADKYSVRSYVASKGLSDILVRLYGVWDNANEIDFEALPNSFVLKTNHGCGEILLVKDKSQVDLKKVRRRFSKYLRTPYGYEAAEYHYLKIPPKVIAEEFLVDNSGQSHSLIDYKFYVFHGKPQACAVFFDRILGGHNVSYCLYDMDWQCIENTNLHTFDQKANNIQKPINFERMKEICNILAAQFPFVRLDFYEVNGKLYFGEFTFTPSGLSSKSCVYEKDRMMSWGQLMDLSRCPVNLRK